jgi:hypothetical protein
LLGIHLIGSGKLRKENVPGARQAEKNFVREVHGFFAHSGQTALRPRTCLARFLQ